MNKVETDTGVTPLACAAQGGYEAVVEHLLKAGGGCEHGSDR